MGGAEVPSADMDNVNIAGTSNGAALTYQIMINTGPDRPFKRALPMVSSLIGPQYHEDQFWTFSEAAPDHQTNDFDVPVVPTFNEISSTPTSTGRTTGRSDTTARTPGRASSPGPRCTPP